METPAHAEWCEHQRLGGGGSPWPSGPIDIFRPKSLFLPFRLDTLFRRSVPSQVEPQIVSIVPRFVSIEPRIVSIGPFCSTLSIPRRLDRGCDGSTRSEDRRSFLSFDGPRSIFGPWPVIGVSLASVQRRVGFERGRQAGARGQLPRRNRTNTCEGRTWEGEREGVLPEEKEGEPRATGKSKPKGNGGEGSCGATPNVPKRSTIRTATVDSENNSQGSG